MNVSWENFYQEGELNSDITTYQKAIEINPNSSGEKVICLDDTPRDALENLQKKHSIDLELYHRSFDNCQ